MWSLFRAARLQNEIAPDRKKKNQFHTTNGLKKREKKDPKTIRNVTETFKAPLRPLKYISPALL